VIRPGTWHGRALRAVLFIAVLLLHAGPGRPAAAAPRRAERDYMAALRLYVAGEFAQSVRRLQPRFRERDAAARLLLARAYHKLGRCNPLLTALDGIELNTLPPEQRGFARRFIVTAHTRCAGNAP
jgi:hypothetical protein